MVSPATFLPTTAENGGDSDATVPSRSGILEDAFLSLKYKLDAIEQIRYDLTQEKIPVPGVVVVGNQSAGKSSLLEAISGINFPRAQNTCTRRPCVVNLQTDPSLAQPYALVSEKADFSGSKRIHNMDDIGLQIDELTKRMCADSFSPDPIHVRVVQHEGPTLSLIDLPGITHIVGGGSQKDVHGEIVGMIEEYVKNKEMVILVVVPATEDFGNAEALKIAQRYDPDGIRTLGVATKSDSVMAYSDLREKVQCLRENDIKLHLGWIAVRCRNPKEVENNVSAKDIIREEAKLFQTHEALSGLDKKFWGMPTLVERIVKVQSSRVEAFIPGCKEMLIKRISDVKRKIGELPPECQDNAARLARFTRDAQQLTTFLSALSEAREKVENSHFNIAPRTFEKYRDFKMKIEESMPRFTAQDYSRVVEEEVKECMGAGLSNFMSHPVFKRLIRSIFDPLLLTESEALVEEVQEYMREVLGHFTADKFKDFPLLVSAIKDLIADVIDEAAGQTLKNVRAIVEAELADTYTQDGLYDSLISTFDRAAATAHNNLIRAASGGAVYAPALDTTIMSQLSMAGITYGEVDVNFFPAYVQCTEDQQMRMVMCKQLCVLAYTKVLRKRVYDSIPMQIRRHLVAVAIEKFGNGIILEYSDGDKLEALMQERPEKKAKREELQASLGRLSRSLDKLKAL